MRRYCVRKEKCGVGFCDALPGQPCIFEYDEAKSPAEMRYQGDQWPPPRRWLSKDGTLVYRTYSDYVDD